MCFGSEHNEDKSLESEENSMRIKSRLLDFERAQAYKKNSQESFDQHLSKYKIGDPQYSSQSEVSKSEKKKKRKKKSSEKSDDPTDTTTDKSKNVRTRRFSRRESNKIDKKLKAQKKEMDSKSKKPILNLSTSEFGTEDFGIGDRFRDNFVIDKKSTNLNPSHSTDLPFGKENIFDKASIDKIVEPEPRKPKKNKDAVPDQTNVKKPKKKNGKKQEKKEQEQNSESQTDSLSMDSSVSIQSPGSPNGQHLKNDRKLKHEDFLGKIENFALPYLTKNKVSLKSEGTGSSSSKNSNGILPEKVMSKKSKGRKHPQICLIILPICQPAETKGKDLSLEYSRDAVIPTIASINSGICQYIDNKPECRRVGKEKNPWSSQYVDYNNELVDSSNSSSFNNGKGSESSDCFKYLSKKCLQSNQPWQ